MTVIMTISCGVVLQSETYIAPHAHDTLKPDPMLEAGLPLPRALQREFPPELIATPIEDIDKYYENKMVRHYSLSLTINVSILINTDQYDH